MRSQQGYEIDWTELLYGGDDMERRVESYIGKENAARLFDPNRKTGRTIY